MDDSIINPILLSSSVHLENVEQLIKNLEKQTVNIDNFEDILNNQNRQELITKSFSSSTIPINDNFLIKNIKLTNNTLSTNHNSETISMDSLLTQHDLFENNELKKQKILLTNDQSLYSDQDNGFTWDNQYDTQANYRLTFSTDKSPQIDSKIEKSRRHKHRSKDQKMSSTYSDDGLSSNITNNMNDWSMRSSFNTFEQKQPIFIPFQSNPASSLSQQQQQQVPNNNSSNSSTTTTISSSSSSTSWKHMKKNQRITSEIEIKKSRPPSPLSLYKIFQQKSNINTLSPRHTLQFYREKNDSIVPNNMTISNETIITDKSKRSLSQSHTNIDQAIQTSILLDSTSNSNINNQYRSIPIPTSKSESYYHFTIPSSSIHKSLPDLSFLSQYSKELPRSRTASSLLPTSSSSIIAARTTPSPTLIQQQKQDSERPRTLKSIKRYKNNKHSTEPLGVFYSPQLRKTFATIPASAIITGPKLTSTIMKMKLPSTSSSQSVGQQQTLNLKTCLKYGSKANLCDIQTILYDRKSPVPSSFIPDSTNNKVIINDLTSPLSKRHCSEADILKPSDNSWFLHEHHSDFNLTSILQEENLTKKSVSFSENISKHLISPCNPIITFNDNNMTLYENKKRLTKRPMIHYGEMRRCQTDIIVVDPVLHLHSFTDSPPNEFRLQETDYINTDIQDDDDQIIMEKSQINIISNLDDSIPIIINPSSSIPNQSDQSLTKISNSLPMNNTSIIILDHLLEKINDIIKRLFEIKRSDKAFFLNNEHNLQLDFLLKNDLCTAIQNILEHGLKSPKKDLTLIKRITLWKIIETSINHRQVPQVYYEAKQIAQNASSYWLYKFQAFIFALLNKCELINWLYYFTRQKDIIQRYYQIPDALILVSISSTFNLFERIMTQLEKLTPLAFRLTYYPPNIPLPMDDQFNISMISTNSIKNNAARDWVMTISRRASKNSTQTNSTDTFRSTLSRKFNAFFMKTNTSQQQQRKSSSVVTAKLPESKQHILQSKSPAFSRRPRLSNVFANATATTNKPIIIPSPKLNNRHPRGISPSSLSAGIIKFQSKIPRPSLNVDKQISTRYRSTAPPPK